jgi:hypothetical protein
MIESCVRDARQQRHRGIPDYDLSGAQLSGGNKRQMPLARHTAVAHSLVTLPSAKAMSLSLPMWDGPGLSAPENPWSAILIHPDSPV